MNMRPIFLLDGSTERAALGPSLLCGAVAVETGSPSAATNWLNTAHQAVRPYSVGGYVNYIEANPAAVAVLRPEPIPAGRRTAEV